MPRGRSKTEMTEAQTKAKKLLVAAYATFGSWAKVGEYYGLNRGLCAGVANGSMRAPPAALRALGLSVEMGAAPVCPTCGEVHTVSWCTKVHGEPIAGQPRRPRQRREASQYIARWSSAHLRWAFENREVMA
jgi:hypothetical protein